MSWYAASVVMAIEVLEGEQEVVPMEEVVFLIEAKSVELALTKAHEIGALEDAAGAQGIEWCHRPARNKFSRHKKTQID